MSLLDCAKDVVEAYAARFGSVADPRPAAERNYTGPIDEQMRALASALRSDEQKRNARRWRYLTEKQRLLWSNDGPNLIKWVFWVGMPPPDDSPEKLTPTSVMDELAAAIDAAIDAEEG